MPHIGGELRNENERDELSVDEIVATTDILGLSWFPSQRPKTQNIDGFLTHRHICYFKLRKCKRRLMESSGLTAIMNASVELGGINMGFAENLQQIRKDKRLSQEELAEMLDVSRQAVSKWEQGIGYPEVDKLLLLSSKLSISLDDLMSTEIAKESNTAKDRVTGSIMITSPYENVIVNCTKVMSSQPFSGGKKAPKYALFGSSGGGSSYWGEQTAFLGWYATGEELSREVKDIT